jgi:hypothetical protein
MVGLMSGHEAVLYSHVASFSTRWLNRQFGRQFSLETAPASNEELALAVDGTIRLAFLISRLYETAPEQEGLLATTAERLSENIGGACILWVPPGGVLPADEPAASAFVLRVETAARGLGPGERGEVRLPATIRLAKLREDGAYVSVMGALSPYWTEISERVRGAYLLDSTQMKRLPPSAAWRDALFERLGRNAASLAVDESVSIETEQAWTLQRLEHGSGVGIVSAAPEIDPYEGPVVRRTVRRCLQVGAARFAERRADLQGMVLIGTYESMEREPVTAAIRGFDPRTYAGLDFVALAADGEMKFVLPPRILPWT